MEAFCAAPGQNMNAKTAKSNRLYLQQAAKSRSTHSSGTKREMTADIALLMVEAVYSYVFFKRKIKQ